MTPFLVSFRGLEGLKSTRHDAAILKIASFNTFEIGGLIHALSPMVKKLKPHFVMDALHIFVINPHEHRDLSARVVVLIRQPFLAHRVNQIVMALVAPLVPNFGAKTPIVGRADRRRKSWEIEHARP